MRIAFFVNDIALEYPRYTTTVLAWEAYRRGHSICYVTPEDFICRPDDRLAIRVVAPSKTKLADRDALFENIQACADKGKTVDMSDVDVLMLRNDPSLELGARPWAEQIGLMFGKLAASQGVLVLNDPEGLSRAQNKLYFQTYPEVVRPKTLISKSPDEIKSFITAHKGKVIVKPLQGSGGKNVFIIRSQKDQNLNQIIETVSKEGYVIAQGYLPKAAGGDIRLFVMNGLPLAVDGKYAAIRRVPAKGEVRSNMHARGKAAKARIGDKELAIAELVRPKLVQDGMFLVGLDIVGDKILEVNVFSPGALHSCMESEGVDFAAAIVDAIERKLDLRRAYGPDFPNLPLATL